MTLAVLFPGQGSQYAGMLHDLPDSSAIAATVDETRSWLAHHGANDIDSAAALQDTTNVQLALLVAGVACARAIAHDHGLTPRVVAGHSVGAFAAAVSIGVLTLAEALTVVELRGRWMKQACSAGIWGMAAVTGLPIRACRTVTERISTSDDPLWMANINSESQVVFSGTRSALSRAADAARTAGATDFRRLDVTVASHCPLQAGTATQLAAHLARLPRRTPTGTYLSNTRGRKLRTAAAILDDLAQAVCHPVQWYDASRLMPELGVTCAIEAQPGHVLTRLLSANASAITSISLQDDGLAATAVRVHRLLGADRLPRRVCEERPVTAPDS